MWFLHHLGPALPHADYGVPDGGPAGEEGEAGGGQGPGVQVGRNEGTRPAHTCAAVNQQGSRLPGPDQTANVQSSRLTLTNYSILLTFLINQ